MNLKNSIVESIEDFFYYGRGRKLRDVYYTIVYSIPKGIKNIIEYAPIIYKDRDFDHGYLTELMLFKMKRMQKFFHSEDVVSVPNKELLKSLDDSIMYLKYVADEEHHFTYSDPDFNFEKCEPPHPDSNGKGYFCFTYKEKYENGTLTEEDIDRVRKERWKRTQEADKLLMNMFLKNFRKFQLWWD